ncbi:uncharacterized protein LOC111252061 isoform X2 [Varroa destructor]|uniref:Secreted protein n=1 Tax=Varroa destructor TaxID=109461 RepID=A0A7M7MI17_VARDE|nr:uncharacterized protein LOC111252061 isoform X2 [Varroa destructor]
MLRSSKHRSDFFDTSVLMLSLMSELIGVASAECFIGKAIQDTELCSNTFQGMFEKKDDSGKERKFNATNPADLREACCSMERLERCLQAASTDAGCRDEVRFIVEHMTATARKLIHSLYKIQCNKVDCSSGAGRSVGHASWSLLALSSVAVILRTALQEGTLLALR